jgi:hypothetical protein
LTPPDLLKEAVADPDEAEHDDEEHGVVRLGEVEALDDQRSGHHNDVDPDPGDAVLAAAARALRVEHENELDLEGDEDREGSEVQRLVDLGFGRIVASEREAPDL